MSSRNVLVSVSEVTRLLLGLQQTGKPSEYPTSHPSQLSLAIPLWVGAMSTRES